MKKVLPTALFLILLMHCEPPQIPLNPFPKITSEGVNVSAALVDGTKWISDDMLNIRVFNDSSEIFIGYNDLQIKLKSEFNQFDDLVQIHNKELPIYGKISYYSVDAGATISCEGRGTLHISRATLEEIIDFRDKDKVIEYLILSGTFDWEGNNGCLVEYAALIIL